MANRLYPRIFFCSPKSVLVFVFFHSPIHRIHSLFVISSATVCFYRLWSLLLCERYLFGNSPIFKHIFVAAERGFEQIPRFHFSWQTEIRCLKLQQYISWHALSVRLSLLTFLLGSAAQVTNPRTHTVPQLPRTSISQVPIYAWYSERWR